MHPAEACLKCQASWLLFKAWGATYLGTCSSMQSQADSYFPKFVIVNSWSCQLSEKADISLRPTWAQNML